MNLLELLGALAGLPRLDGFACAGKHHLFDPPAVGERADEVEARQFQAIETCQTCPALVRCRDWYLGLDVKDRPTGVTAGFVHNARNNRSGGSPHDQL